MTPLLRIEDLVVEGRPPSGIWVQTVNGVSVDVAPGEVVALIGESGAGKTTVALGSLGYTRPGTRFKAGRVFLEDREILGLSPRERRDLRGKDVAYVAQSAQSALNPAIPIGEQIAESLVLHGIASGSDACMSFDLDCAAQVAEESAPAFRNLLAECLRTDLLDRCHGMIGRKKQRGCRSG